MVWTDFITSNCTSKSKSDSLRRSLDRSIGSDIYEFESSNVGFKFPFKDRSEEIKMGV